MITTASLRTFPKTCQLLALIAFIALPAHLYAQETPSTPQESSPTITNPTPSLPLTAGHMSESQENSSSEEEEAEESDEEDGEKNSTAKENRSRRENTAPQDNNTTNEETTEAEIMTLSDSDISVENVDSAPAEESEVLVAPGMIRVNTSTLSDKTPPKTMRLKGETLEDNGVASVAEAMLLVPGAQTEYAIGGVSRVNIDSLPAGHISVLRDGVPLGRMTGGPNGSGVDFATIAIDPTTIDHVEILRGLGPNGTSGVLVNIITKEGKAFRASITGRYAQALVGKVSNFAANSFRREIMGSFELPTSVFFKPEDTTVNQLWKEFTLQGQIGYYNRNAINFDGKQAPDNPAQGNLFGTTQLLWQRQANKLSASFSGQKSDVVTLSEKRAPNDDYVSNIEYVGEFGGQWNYPIGYFTHFSQFKYNLHKFAKRIKSNNSIDPRTDTTSKLFNQSLGATFLLGDHDLKVQLSLAGEWVHRIGYSGYSPELNKSLSNNSLSISDHWYITPEWDLRAELRPSYSYPFGFEFEGLISTSWKPNDHYNLSLSLSRSRRVPTAEELYLEFNHAEVGYTIIGNPELKSELLNSLKLEGGIRFSWIGLTVSPFFHYITNAIVPISDSGQLNRYTFANKDEVLTTGSNFILEFTLPWNILIKGTYTYTPLANVFDPAATEKFKDRLALRPENVYRFEVAGRWLEESQPLGARFWIDGRGKLPVPASLANATVGSNYAEPNFQINAAITYQPLRWLRLGVDFRNLANQTNPTWGPSVGRYMMFTATLTQKGVFW